jgi:SAM-dependent methyltransferase
MVCGNEEGIAMKFVETVYTNTRIQCEKCNAIYFTGTPRDLPKYNAEYNSYFFRPGDISKAGLMAAKIASFCEKHLKNPRIFEAGVGNGLTLFLLDQMGYKTKGIDLDLNWCQYLAKKYSIFVLTGNFENRDLIEHFDLIYSSHTIEHSENPRRWFEKANLLLNEKGYFILDTPDTYFWNRQSGRWHHFETRHPFEHLCILSKEAIFQLAHEYGFDLCHIERQFEYQSLYAILQKRFEIQ